LSKQQLVQVTFAQMSYRGL